MTANTKDRKDVHILYMEDDPGLARLFKKRLERAGYAVDIAVNGKVGLEMFESNVYDIIAVDQMMPEVEGIMVIKILSSKDDPPPMIMITGAGSETVAVQAMKLGAADYIIKDINGNYLELLPTLIEKILINQKVKRERNKAEIALRESEEKYRNLVEMATDGILIIQNGLIKYANKRFAEISGYAMNEIMTKSIGDCDFVEKDEISNVLDHYRRLTAEVKINEIFESVIRHKDGEKINVEINIGEILYNGKKAVVAMVRDISIRKKMEEEIIRGQKLESIGMLAGGIAHDFNNILTGILGNISLAIMDCSKDSDLYKSLDDAEKASLRAKDLVNQFIIFSEGGAPIKKVTSIGSLVRDTVSIALSGTGIQSEVYIADDLWPVNIDEDQIRQLLNNLLVNSKEALYNSGKVFIRTENIDIEKGSELSLKPGKYIRITLKDNGIGIPAEIMPKIFDPFFSTKPKNRGLGLTAAFLIIKRHNGHLQVESKSGEGTTVSIYLPGVVR